MVCSVYSCVIVFGYNFGNVCINCGMYYICFDIYFDIGFGFVGE